MTAKLESDGTYDSMGDRPPKFTLRFRSPRTHEMLGLLADAWGISKNQLAEQMLERELHAAALALERDMAHTVELLRSYDREADVEGHIRAFAEGEAFGEDPLRSRSKLTPELGADIFGIADVFSG
jgi:hypothetical protein